MKNRFYINDSAGKFEKFLSGLGVVFLSFLAGSFFGYLWMAHAYGLLP